MNRKSVFFLLGALLIAGCQSVPASDIGGVSPGAALPAPSSNGPSGPPAVKGPSSPPQAVTEALNVEYKLP